MTNPAVTNAMIHLASYVASALWQIPLLFAAGWLSARVLRRLSPAAEHNIWQLTLLLCVLMPALPAPGSSGHIVTVKMADIRVESSSSERVAPALAWRGQVLVPTAAVQVVCGLWLLAALITAIRLGFALRRTHLLLAAASPCILPPDLEPIWQDCLRRSGVGKARVLTSPRVAGPITVNLGGHVLLLPEYFIGEVNHVDFRAAAAHECAHMRRNDFLSNLVYWLIALPVAFHPVLSLIRQQLITSREMACDRAAADAMGSAVAYGSALLRLATWMVGSRPAQTPAMGAAVGIFDSNSLEERMERLSTPAPSTGISARIALATVAISCLSATAFAAAAGAVSLAPLAHAASTSSVPSPAPLVVAVPAVTGIETAPQESVKAMAPAKPTVYNIGGDVAPPSLVFEVNPDYPKELRNREDLQGECVIGLVVDTNGKPKNVHVKQSLGKGFDENAIAAVKQYRFKPAMRNGLPVPVAMNVAVNFRRF